MTWPAIVGVALLPHIAFWVGSFVIGLFSNRREVQQRLAELPKKQRTPLNQRFLGYKVEDVQRLWEKLARDPDLLPAEQRSLRLDLLFPLLYGSAFAVSLWLAWRLRDRTFGAAWLLVPVVICVLADWTENFSQLKQLRLYQQSGPDALQVDGIRIASTGTIVKLLFFTGCSILIVFLLWK
jgi:hypothetical protein